MMRAFCLAAGLILGLSTASLAETNVPDPKLTPGIARHDMSVAEMCATAWGKDERAVTAEMKREVFFAYGFPKGNADPRCPCEVDHLISRELLGADDVRNLMIQTYGRAWNAHMKDRLENRLHAEVCGGRLGLQAAQQMLVDDWRGAYTQYFGSGGK